MLLKTKKDRLIEILKVRYQMSEMGFNDSHSEVKRLFNVLSDFVNNGTYIKDKFVISGHDKVIDLILLPRLNAKNIIVLRTVKK